METTAQDGIQIEESGHRLRISWHNGRMKKSSFALWFCIVFWIIWAPATLFTTGVLFLVPDSPKVFLTIWLIFGWAGTILIPVGLLQRSFGGEWIELSRESLSWGSSGPRFFVRSRHTIPHASVSEIALGDRASDEPSFALIVYETPNSWGYRPRRQLGAWLRDEDTVAIFNRVRDFAASHNLPLKVERHV